MAKPKAKLTADKNDLFINPYNFVSLSSSVDRKNISDESGDDKLTGYIVCTLKVKDMLALPDHSAEDKNISGAYDFYKIDGKPVIPGSEIRGCIRSVFEAITPSCFSVVNGNVLTSRVSRPENGGKPGILEYNECTRQWELYEAEKYKKRSNGEEADIERSWKPFKPKGRWKSYFHKTSNKPVFCPTDAQVEKLMEILDIYKDNNASNYRFCECLDEAKRKLGNKQSIAVFYKIESRKINNVEEKVLEYFSPAQVGRNMYENTIPDLLGEHNKCSGKNGYCPACRLFGTLGENNPIASKLRFSDAAEKENVSISEEYVNLPELSSPKITSVEFYTRRSNDDRTENVPIWNYDSEGVTVRGRKFYFHSKPISEEKLGERSIATKPALKDSKFSFKVYFDAISEKELKQLLWVLALGENNIDGHYMHKIGAGRPVGYGSVKITVDEIVTREINNRGDYIIDRKTYNNYEISDALFTGDKNSVVSKAFGDLKLITCYSYVSGYKISYPIADDGENKANSKAAHQWFSSNRKGRTFQRILPPLSENSEALLLPAMKADVIGKLQNDGQDKKSGKCKDCGAPTGINPISNKPYFRCQSCYRKYKNKR